MVSDDIPAELFELVIAQPVGIAGSLPQRRFQRFDDMLDDSVGLRFARKGPFAALFP